MLGRHLINRRTKTGVRLGLVAVLLLIGSVIWPVTAADMTMVDDTRQEFLGQWDCQGTSTVAGVSQPYALHMHNRPDLQNHWLRIDLRQVAASSAQKPLQEVQYWTYTPETLLHSRWGMDNSGNFGLITTRGWEHNRMVWEGYFQLSGARFDYREVVERINGSRTHHRWMGTLRIPDGPVVGEVDVACRKRD